MSIKDLNFQIKKFMDLACSFEIGLQNQLHNAWIFVKCKCPNGYKCGQVGW